MKLKILGCINVRFYALSDSSRIMSVAWSGAEFELDWFIVSLLGCN